MGCGGGLLRPPKWSRNLCTTPNLIENNQIHCFPSVSDSKWMPVSVNSWWTSSAKKRRQSCCEAGQHIWISATRECLCFMWSAATNCQLPGWGLWPLAYPTTHCLAHISQCNSNLPPSPDSCLWSTLSCAGAPCICSQTLWCDVMWVSCHNIGDRCHSQEPGSPLNLTHFL